MRPGSPPGPPVTTPRPGAAVVRRLGGAQVHQHQHVTRAWSSNSSSTSWVRAAATRRLKQRSWSSPAGHDTTSSPARHGTARHTTPARMGDLLNHRAGLAIAGVANIASYRKLYYRSTEISLNFSGSTSYRKLQEIQRNHVQRSTIMFSYKTECNALLLLQYTNQNASIQIASIL